MCAKGARESRGAEQGSSTGLREGDEECSTRILSVEKVLRRSQLGNKLLMTTSNKYKFQVMILKNCG